MQVRARLGELRPRDRRLFSDLIGKPLDPDAVAQRVTALYGRGGLDTLDYHVTGDPGRYGLALDARPNSQGPNYLRFGLSLQDDFQGNPTAGNTRPESQPRTQIRGASECR